MYVDLYINLLSAQINRKLTTIIRPNVSKTRAVEALAPLSGASASFASRSPSSHLLSHFLSFYPPLLSHSLFQSRIGGVQWCI